MHGVGVLWLSLLAQLPGLFSCRSHDGYRLFSVTHVPSSPSRMVADSSSPTTQAQLPPPHQMPGVVATTTTRSLAAELSAASPPPMSFGASLRRAIFRCFSPSTPSNPSQLHAAAFPALLTLSSAQSVDAPMFLPPTRLPNVKSGHPSAFVSSSDS